MKLLALAPLCALAASIATPNPNPNHVNYEGYKVFRVRTRQHLADVQSKLAAIDYDLWNDDIEHHIDIMLSPDQVEPFEKLGLDAHCMHEDLGASIKAESATTSVYKRDVDDLAWFDNYHPYEDHVQWWSDLHESFPDNSKPTSTGTSYEGRDMFGLHLWGADGPGKPAVIWHGTVHAREWIPAMVLEYLALQLVTGYPKDNVTQSFLDKHDFYIFPFVNPDGFIYAQTTNRLWRKNRQPPPPPPANQTCIGRDINRQWPHMWDGHPRGASTDPCQEVYKGEQPSDSPENEGLVKFVDKVRDEQGITMFIDWHAYGQFILSPWGYDCRSFEGTPAEHISLASYVSRVIRAFSDVTFIFGPNCATLYPTTGASVDYLAGPGKAKWAYSFELRDTGDAGFILPAEQIRLSCEEQWEGQLAMLSMMDEAFFEVDSTALSVEQAW